MRRILATASLFSLAPAAVLAEGTMPQMDFHNMLTSSQVVWMVVILVVLYALLAGWALPGMGKVLEGRAAVIARDLAAAQAAKTQADQAVRTMKAEMNAARAQAQAQIAEAAAQAKAEAQAQAKALGAMLDSKLAAAEAQIADARANALAAIKPVAVATAGNILHRLIGAGFAEDGVSRRVDDALAANKAA